MSIRIIEYNIVGKNKDQGKCEDKIVTNDNFVCVIDGATSKSNFRINDQTTGIKVGSIIEQAILEADENLSCEEVIRFLSKKIQNYYIDEQILDRVKKYPRDRLIASCVIFSKKKNEVWIVGDCQCKVGGAVYSNKNLIDDITSSVRSLIIALNLKKGKSIEELMANDVGRNFIMPILKEQAIFQNNISSNDISYPVLDGFEVPINQIKKIDVKNHRIIIMATDGYPALKSSLKASEKDLDEILKKDPLCYYLYKSTKGLIPGNNSYDDRAYIKFEK